MCRLKRVMQNPMENPNPAGVLVVDPEGQILHVDPAFCQMVGWNEGELIGQRPPFTFWPPEDVEGIQQHLESVIRSEIVPTLLEMRFRRRDEERFDVQVLLSQLADGAGQPIGWIGSIHDTTPYRHAKDALRESEERYRIISELTSDYMYAYRLAPDGTMTRQWTTPAFTRVTGFKPEDFDQRGWEHFFHPDDRGWFAARLEALVAGRPHEQVYRIITRSGETRWLRDKALSVPDPDGGRALLVYASARDITGRKQAEEALRRANEELELRVRERTRELEQANERLRIELDERTHVAQQLRQSEERFSKIFHASPVASAIGELDRFRYIDVNSACITLFGYAREEMIGRSVMELGLWPDPEEAARVREMLLATGSVRDHQFEFRTKSGEIGQALTYMELIEIGGERRILAHALDITERTRAEAELRKTRDELEDRVAERTAELHAANLQLRELARRVVSAQEEERARVSRELHDEAGQALTVLKVHLDLIREDLPHEQHSLKERLEEAAEIADATMDTLHSLAQGLRPADLDTLDTSVVLVELCHDFARRTGLPVECGCNKIDSQAPIVSITLYRILQEALTNVAKHAMATRVWVSCEREGNAIILSIEDNGQGVRHRRNGERGLGVIGIRERLDILRGNLVLEARPGGGTRLVASIPCQEDS
jgi:PAS domain S-box-containing protein